MVPESRISIVRDFFRKNEINVFEKQIDDDYVFYGGYTISGNETLLFRLILESDEPWLRMIVNFPPVEADEKMMLLIAELISRVNFRLTFGRFEMNFRNGQVRFTSCQDASVLESEEKDRVLERQILRGIVMSHKFCPYLKQVCAGESPRDLSATFRNEKA